MHCLGRLLKGNFIWSGAAGSVVYVCLLDGHRQHFELHFFFISTFTAFQLLQTMLAILGGIFFIFYVIKSMLLRR